MVAVFVIVVLLVVAAGVLAVALDPRPSGAPQGSVEQTRDVRITRSR